MTPTIVHIITTIDLGGAEKQLLTLVECQKRLGAEVEVLYLKGRPALIKDFNYMGINVATNFSTLNFLQQVLALRKIAKTKGVLFHAHLPRSELLCALALKKASFVVTRHNSERFFPRAPKAISRVLSRFVLSKAFACISISQAVSDYLENIKEINKSTKLFVIHYGLKQVIPKKRIENRISNKTRRIGTVARLVPQKNIPLLLNALQLLKTQGEFDLHLSIAGDGYLHKELRLMTANLHIDELVTWTGKISKVETFYDGIELFVLTSNYEGFGLVLLEAMSFGVPVVARRISAIPEVLGQSHPGLIESDCPLELAAKITELLSNSNARQKCLAYQSEQLLNFSIEKTWHAHGFVYDQMLKENA